MGRQMAEMVNYMLYKGPNLDSVKYQKLDVLWYLLVPLTA